MTGENPDTSTDAGASTEDGNTPSGTTSTADDKPITMTSQQLAERLARARPADYDDLKAKAAKLDEIEAANKSELEKATEAATTAAAERDAAKAEALRLRIAVKHGIGFEDAELFLTGTDEATLNAQAERLAGRIAEDRRNGTRSPNEGRVPETPALNSSQLEEDLKRVLGIT